MLQTKSRGKRSRRRLRTRWLDQIREDIEDGGQTWPEIKHGRTEVAGVLFERVNPSDWKQLKQEAEEDRCLTPSGR